MTSTDTLTLRRASAADAAALADLAGLDSTRVPGGDVLLAETAGRPVAALSLVDGHVAADPFVPTRDVVALLRVRAEAA